ncbi:MAG: DinB family protein [Actinomycetota bacterium]|nr:DinB family protein [Actinomycetota bacterium]
MSSYDPQDLTDRLRLAGDEFIAFIESLDGSQLKSVTDPEGWPAGVVAHHVAVGAQFCSSLAEHVAKGGELSWTPDFVNDVNAVHAETFADISKEEILDALRTQFPDALKRIGGLTAEQLSRDLGEDKDFGEGPVRFAGDVIEKMMIVHTNDHLDSIKRAAAS